MMKRTTDQDLLLNPWGHVADEDGSIFQTNLNWNERADLRLILKAASQQAAFNRDERHLALRLIAELDQMQLMF
jgi:hypothetical protein